MKLNSTEKIAIEVLERLGYTVVRPTWPDLIIYKEEKGEKSFKFIAVKGTGKRLSRGQKQTFDLLRDLKIETEVVLINRCTEEHKIVDSTEEIVRAFRMRDVTLTGGRQTMKSFTNSLQKKKKEPMKVAEIDSPLYKNLVSLEEEGST